MIILLQRSLKAMKKHFLLLLLFVLPSFHFAQVKSVKIANWKNYAKGAYTLIHDDFCMDFANGIANYADTMAHNRGIPVSFGLVSGHCDEQDWKKANEMIAHGHEVMNHSHNHYCGEPVEWCPTANYTSKDYKVEFDLSTQLIEKHTGIRPTYFVFPFDLFNDTMTAYLETELNFQGARSGIQNTLNHPDQIKPFKTAFHFFRPAQSYDLLNDLADQAVKEGKWAVRGVHGVEDDSWASLPKEGYRKHLDFIKEKKEEGLLWVASAKDVIDYSETRYKTAVDFNPDKNEISLSYKDHGSKAKELTFVIEFKSAIPKGLVLEGESGVISFEKSGQTVLFHAIPDGQGIQLKGLE